MTARTPLLAVHGALHQRLTGDQELMDLVTGVWDGVPEPAAFPYVALGEATEVPDNRLSGYGRQTTHTLHVWSRHPGYSQALTITGRLVALLDHQPLTIPGWHHIATRYEFSQTLTDPEPPGDIRHVPIRFRVVTEQP